MIHRRKGRKLGRTTPHRKSTLSNLSVSLITYKKISTTLAKAKELRRFVEPLLTKSRKALASKKPEYGLHLRREANRFLKDKTAVKTLFDEIAPKIAGRNGGYTRVLKLGRRLGDASEMAVIEFVDYNTGQQAETTESAETGSKSKTAKTTESAKPKAKKSTKKAAATKEKTAEPKKKSKKKETAK